MAGPETNSNRGRFGQCQWEHSAPLVHVVLLAHGNVVQCHQPDEAEPCMGSINNQTGLDLARQVKHELLVLWGLPFLETNDIRLVDFEVGFSRLATSMDDGLGEVIARTNR